MSAELVAWGALGVVLLIGASVTVAVIRLLMRSEYSRGELSERTKQQGRDNAAIEKSASVLSERREEDRVIDSLRRGDF